MYIKTTGRLYKDAIGRLKKKLLFKVVYVKKNSAF